MKLGEMGSEGPVQWENWSPSWVTVVHNTSWIRKLREVKEVKKH